MGAALFESALFAFSSMGHPKKHHHVFVVPSDGVFPRAFRVSFPTVNKGFRAIFDDLRAGLEQWAYVAFTGTLS